MELLVAGELFGKMGDVAHMARRCPKNPGAVGGEGRRAESAAASQAIDVAWLKMCVEKLRLLQTEASDPRKLNSRRRLALWLSSSSSGFCIWPWSFLEAPWRGREATPSTFAADTAQFGRPGQGDGCGRAWVAWRA